MRVRRAARAQLSTTTSTSKAERSSATSTPASPATPLTSSSGSRSDTHRSSSQLYLERRRPNRATSSVPTTQPIPPGIARSCAQQLEAILPTLCRTGGAHAPRQPPPGARLSRSHLRVCPLVWSRHGNPVPTDYLNPPRPTDRCRQPPLPARPRTRRRALDARHHPRACRRAQAPIHRPKRQPRRDAPIPTERRATSPGTVLGICQRIHGKPSLKCASPTRPSPDGPASSGWGPPQPTLLAKLADRLDAPLKPSNTSLARRSIQPPGHGWMLPFEASLEVSLAHSNQSRATLGPPR